MYNCDGFLEKNRDPLSDDILECMRSSNLPFVGVLFKEQVWNHRDHSTHISLDHYVPPLFVEQDVLSVEEPVGGKGKAAKKGQNTVGTQFKSQLDALMARIAETNVNYIRCIKPNSKFVPDEFDPLSVLNQLR